MRFSLQQRVFLLITLINVVVFTAGGAVLVQRLGNQRDQLVQEVADKILFTVRGTIRWQGDTVPRILQWPSWSIFDDALLIDRKYEVLPDGRIHTKGVAINPVGCARRAPDFDEDAVKAALVRAMEERRPIAVAGGRALPIESPREVWGACWYRRDSSVDSVDLFLDLLPWFLLSTVLLVVGTFTVLREIVLKPVKLLATGARRVREGDLATRLEELRRRDEIADLVRSFNLMTSTVESFNARLADEVQRATEQARRAEAAAMTQRRLAAMGELVAGIAHEINNPLGGLQNAVEVLGRPGTGEEKRERYLVLLSQGLARIRETVSQLLRFTPRETRPVPVGLADVLVDAVALVRHRADRQGVRIYVARRGGEDWNLSGEPPAELLALPSVRGARNELGQAFLNLLVNALDALQSRTTDAGGPPEIRLVLERQGDELRVEVRDNGPGVTEEELSRVSDLFYTTKDVGKGTGLGLSIVHNVVDSHGGRILLSSEPGRGFTAELWFPIAGLEGGGGGA